ncbi:ABC transporter substrate-binding protein [Photobacterium lutimaris]|uniref:ABC transporter substrate-binding protein n=2 Tax=Photobacterium lutimaris TaxID=388278 RepID=A0A2T3J5D9_9GAMM|nr:ABC transporter substrate-binding protein [Photobacterium lutimaris]
MNKHAKQIIRLIGLFSLLILSAVTQAKDILTSTPVAYMLASELTKNTGLETQYLPPKRYGMMRLPNWFSSKGAETTIEAAKSATAVITIGAVWPQDPLYVHARQGNIQIVEIDASQSISPRAQGVAALRLESGLISPYAWLNPSNLTRMAAIVSQDLQRLWPDQAETISLNQQQLMIRIRKLINHQQTRLFDAEVDSVILLSQELEDFASGNQLFVVGRYTKPELDWTENEKRTFLETLKDDQSVWVLTSRQLSKKMLAQLPNPERVLTIDSIDRWGREGMHTENPLSRWEIKL